MAVHRREDPYSLIVAVFSWSYNPLSASVAQVFRLLGPLLSEDFDRDFADALGEGPLCSVLDERTDAYLIEEHRLPVVRVLVYLSRLSVAWKRSRASGVLRFQIVENS